MLSLGAINISKCEYLIKTQCNYFSIHRVIFLCALFGMLLSGISFAKAESDDTAAVRAKAEKGDPVAQEEMGGLYGTDAIDAGVPLDYSEAMKWFLKASNQGSTWAQLDIGGMYERGEGVKPDNTEAMRWFLLAANQGNPSAQYKICELYKFGKGVKKDLAEAYFWCSLAITAGINPHDTDILKKQLPPEQAATVRERVKEWQKNHKEISNNDREYPANRIDEKNK